MAKVLGAASVQDIIMDFPRNSHGLANLDHVVILSGESFFPCDTKIQQTNPPVSVFEV